MIEANRGLIASIAEVQAAIGSIEGKSVKIDVDTGAAIAGIAKVKAGLDGLEDKKIKVDLDTGGALADLAALKAAIDAIDAGKLAALTGGGGGGGGASAAAIAAALTAALAAMQQQGGPGGGMAAVTAAIQAMHGSSNTNAASLAAAISAMHGSGNTNTAALASLLAAAHGGANVNAANITAAIQAMHGSGNTNAASLAAAIQAMHGSSNTNAASLAAAIQAMHGSSNTNAASLAAAISAVRGGGPGGGRGGGGGGGGGFVPWAGGGLQAVRFWGMMGAEIASTVVPAVVAAGSAALVGAQGFEQLQGRAQAVYAVSEALGGSLNKTAGQFFGVGNSLQNAQNAAGGGVYGLAGAGINILKSGAGGSFLQQGTNTLAMLDRAAAGAALNVTQGGTGNKLAAALAGGTGYLQQFGEIGANVGTSLLNFAPNLPGVGSDLLSTLTGASGALRAVSGAPAPLLKSFFTYEAASRWLPAILGGQGLIGRMLGLRGVGGLGGLLGKIGLGGAGDALAGLSGPEIGIPLAGFQLESSLLNRLPQGAAGTATANIAKWQTAVGNAGFSGAWQPLGHELTMATAAAAAAPYEAAPSRWQLASRVGIGLEAAYATSPKHQYEQAASGAAQQMGELVDSGPQLVGALKKAGIKGLSMADAFQAATNALLDIPHSFGPNGKVNPKALQQLQDYATMIGPMTQSGGAFGAAVAGYQIMKTPAMSNLATVNQAMDSMTQIMSAGPAGMAALSTMGAALPSGTAGALKSFTSPGGAAAWTSFASTSQPSVISQMQPFQDQMRTGLTLNATVPGAGGGAHRV